jgi:hypothetical protein
VPRWSRPAVRLPAFAALALVGGVFPSFSPGATVYVLALGLTVIVLGHLPPRPGVAPPPVGRRAWWWAVPVLLFGVPELVDYVLGSAYSHPSLSRLLDPVLDGYPARCTGYLIWLLIFWAVVRR